MMRPQILYLNRLKAVACIAVVILHTFFAADAFAQTVAQHTVLLSVRNLMTWSVPCFVMCSGVLLLEPKKEIGMQKIVKSYLPRMVIALVLFSLLFALFDSVFMQSRSVAAILGEGLKNVITGGGWKHMWYIYMMIALYLMLPVYRLVTKSASDKDLRYIVILYGIFLSLAPLSEKFAGLKLPFYIFVFSIYPLFFFAGYYLHKYRRFGRVPAFLMVLVSAVATVWLTYISCSENNENLSDLLSNYSSPVIILGSIGGFVLLRDTSEKRKGFIDAASEIISKCSFGVYLIHMAFLKFIFAVKRYDPMANGGYLTVLLISLLVFVMSLLVTYAFISVKNMFRKKAK